VARPVEIGISSRFTGGWARPKLRRRWRRNSTVVTAMLGNAQAPGITLWWWPCCGELGTIACGARWLRQFTAALAAIGALGVKPLERAIDELSPTLTRTVQVPIWLLVGGALTVLAILVAAVALLWRRNATSDQSTDDEPNAVPVALIQPTRRYW